VIQGTAAAGSLAAASGFAQHAESEDNAKMKVMHIIGQSHIDAAWLWPWRDGCTIKRDGIRSGGFSVFEIEPCPPNA